MNTNFVKLSSAVALSLGLFVGSIAAHVKSQSDGRVVQLAPIIVTPSNTSSRTRAVASDVVALAPIYVTPADTEEGRYGSALKQVEGRSMSSRFSLMVVLEKIRTLVFG